LFAVIPSPSGVRHEDRLVQAEQCNRDEISDEEVRLDERKRKRRKEDGQKDVEHALLRLLRADLNDLLAVGDRGFLYAFETDVCFDELNCTIGAGRDSLR